MDKDNLTEWFDGAYFVPAHVGEYNASQYKDPAIYRWWNGRFWSYAYHKTQSNEVIERIMACKAEEYIAVTIQWRGLANKPE